MRLLEPQSAARYLSDSPPTLLWTIAPGADHYQVGFTAKPYFSSVSSWYDVRDTSWQVPSEVWKKLASGQLYWTVRVVEPSGQTRKPAPLRTIARDPKDALAATLQQPRLAASGAPLLEWKPLDEPAYYRVTISSDADFVNVIRRYLTPSSNADLRAARKQLQAGQTYYWRVEAFAHDGRWLLTGPTHSFIAPVSAQALLDRPAPYLVAALADPPGPPSVAESIANLSPLPGDSIMDTRPRMLIEFKKGVSLEGLALSIDNTDVTAMALQQEERLSYRPFFPLAEGEHTVVLSLGLTNGTWTFRVGGSAPTSQPATLAKPVGDAEQPQPARPPVSAAKQPAGPPTPSAGAPKPAVTAPGQHAVTQVGMTTQWVSGSPADTTALNAAQQVTSNHGPWKFEMNGSGLLNSSYSPDPQHVLGHFNNYIIRGTYKQKDWGADLRFGILTPSIYGGSQFVTPGSARQGVDSGVRTPAGTFGFFANTSDTALGAGTGVNFQQRLIGAGYLAPLPTKRAELRLMWLSARDEGTPTAVGFDASGNPLGVDQFGNPITTTVQQAKPSSGDMYGALLRVQLHRTWAWTSEYAWSYNHPDITDPSSQRLFGRAWKSGIQGDYKKAKFTFVYRDVGPNFATPANPGLTSVSTPDRRGFDISLARPFKLEAVDLGTFTVGYTFLQNNVRATALPELDLNNLTGGWTKLFKPATTVTVQVHETRTMPGKEPSAFQALPSDQQQADLADNRDLGFNATIAQKLKKLTLTLSGGRDWYRNGITTGQNTITSNINVGANWNATRIFRLQSNAGVNYVNSDPLTLGANRMVSAMIQPMLIWQRKGLQFMPTMSVSKTDSALGDGTVLADQLSLQYAGRLSWKMPGKYKFSVLALEAGRTHIHDAIQGTDTNDPRILFIWTINWGNGPKATVVR